MEKILILGAGNAQIDLIQYCKDSGLEVHCCSYLQHDSGMSLADHFALINILDKDRIVEYCRENRIGHVYSIGSDIAVPVIAYAASKIGTESFYSYEAANLCCDKAKMRRVLEGKTYCPVSIVGSDPDRILEESEKKDLYPIEIKPVDSQGQRGVSTVRNAEELKRGFCKAMSYSRKGEVILEEYIEGDEVSVNAYLCDGKIRLSVLSDREIWSGFQGGLIHEHHLPSVYEGTDAHARILELVQDTVQTLGLKDGPVYFQIMIRENKPYLIEVTPRLDGCHLWRLIREACGIDLLDMAMNHLLHGDPFRNQKAPDEISIKPDRRMSLEFFCQVPGERVDSAAFCKKDAVYRAMYYQDGDIVRPVNGHMEKCGYRIYEREDGKTE